MGNCVDCAQGAEGVAKEAEAAVSAAQAETARREEQRTQQHLREAAKAAAEKGYGIEEGEERDKMESLDTRYLMQDGHEDILALLEGLEQRLVGTPPFDAWHPDKVSARTNGKLDNLIAPARQGTLHDDSWSAWWQTAQPYMATLHAWSMRAARAAKRRCIRATEDHRAHKFAMGEYGLQEGYLMLGLLLIMLPSDAQAITLVNIPKPVSGFRPLALAHDLYCMLTGVISSHLQTSLECAQIFMSMIVAYRPGRSGTQLISAMLCGIEDAREHGKALFATLEDFEKFYDACSTDLILMSMHAHGLSETGYAQWVGESLRDRDMHIVTSIGTTGAVPRGCGYLQGSALSCVVVNFIVQILHTLWKDGGGAEGYGFDFDEALRLISASYSDDNNAYNGNLFCAIKSVELFGWFSIVTRIGRSTKQSHVLCFGLAESIETCISKCSPEEQEYIRENLHKRGAQWVIRTHAWSRERGCVIMTEIPLVVQATEIKYLGLYDHSLMGCKIHGQNMYKGARNRLVKVQKQVRCFPSFAYLYNAMVIPVFTWLALQGRASMVCAALLDRSAIRTAKRLLRLHHSACAHEVWLPAVRGFLGKGLRSACQAMLQEKAGALDVLMNDTCAPGHALAAERMCAAQRAAMCRWEEALQREPLTTHGEAWTIPLKDRVLDCPKRGFVFAGVWALARHGVYMRDRENELVGRVLDNLAIADVDATVLGNKYKKSAQAHPSDHIIGSGTLHSAQYMWGGVCEAMIMHVIAQVSEECEGEGLYSRKAKRQLVEDDTWQACERYEVGMAARVGRAVRQAIVRWESDVKIAHSLYVWRAPQDAEAEQAEDAPYTDLNNYDHAVAKATTHIPRVLGAPQHGDDYELTGRGAELLRMTVSDIADVHGQHETKDFMVASDGSADLRAGRVGYGVVVMVNDPGCDQGAAPLELDIPRAKCSRLVLAVGSPMPRRWGVDRATNNLAEGRSLNIAHELLPPQVKAVVITDSQIWYDACAHLAQGKAAKRTNQRTLRSDWRSELGRMAAEAARRLNALAHLQQGADTDGADGVDEWVVGGAQVWGEWCPDRRVVMQVCEPAEDAEWKREQWMQVADVVKEQNEEWTHLVATMLVVAAQKQAEQGRRSNWLIVAREWAGRVVIKIKSHIDKIRAGARANGEDVPDYPNEEVACANIHADKIADVMQKGETPADVWWVPRTGTSLRFGFTVMGRTVDGCARKCMGTLCHQQIRHQLGERIQRGAMARWQEVLAELALGKRRNVGMAEEFRIVADIPRLRAGTGAAHTYTIYTSRAARLASAMDAGEERVCVVKDQRMTRRTTVEVEDADEMRDTEAPTDIDEAHELAMQLADDVDCMSEENALQRMQDLDQREQDRESAEVRSAAFALDLTDTTVLVQRTRGVSGTPRKEGNGTPAGSPITRAEAARNNTSLMGVGITQHRVGYESCNGVVVAEDKVTRKVTVKWQDSTKSTITRNTALRDAVYEDALDENGTDTGRARVRTSTRNGKFTAGDVVELRQCEVITEAMWMAQTGREPHEEDWANQLLVGTVRSTERTCPNGVDFNEGVDSEGVQMPDRERVWVLLDEDMHTTDQPVYACETEKLRHAHIMTSAGALLGPVTESERQCRFCTGRVEIGDQRHIHTACTGLAGVVEARRLCREHINMVAEELNQASNGELREALNAALDLDDRIENLKSESDEFRQFARDYPWLPRMQIMTPDLDREDGVERPGDEFPRHAGYRGIVTDALAGAVMRAEHVAKVKAEAEAEQPNALASRWKPTLLPALGAAAWAVHRAAELELRNRLGVAQEKVKQSLKVHEAAAAAALEETGVVSDRLKDVVQCMQKAVHQIGSQRRFGRKHRGTQRTETTACVGKPCATRQLTWGGAPNNATNQTTRLCTVCQKVDKTHTACITLLGVVTEGWASTDALARVVRQYDTGQHTEQLGEEWEAGWNGRVKQAARTFKRLAPGRRGATGELVLEAIGMTGVGERGYIARTMESVERCRCEEASAQGGGHRQCLTCKGWRLRPRDARPSNTPRPSTCSAADCPERAVRKVRRALGDMLESCSRTTRSGAELPSAGAAAAAETTATATAAATDLRLIECAQCKRKTHASCLTGTSTELCNTCHADAQRSRECTNCATRRHNACVLCGRTVCATHAVVCKEGACCMQCVVVVLVHQADYQAMYCAKVGARANRLILRSPMHALEGVRKGSAGARARENLRQQCSMFSVRGQAGTVRVQLQPQGADDPAWNDSADPPKHPPRDPTENDVRPPDASDTAILRGRAMALTVLRKRNAERDERTTQRCAQQVTVVRQFTHNDAEPEGGTRVVMQLVTAQPINTLRLREWRATGSADMRKVRKAKGWGPQETTVGAELDRLVKHVEQPAGPRLLVQHYTRTIDSEGDPRARMYARVFNQEAPTGQDMSADMRAVALEGLVYDCDMCGAGAALTADMVVRADRHAATNYPTFLKLTEPEAREAWLLTVAAHYGVTTRPRDAAKKLIMALQYVHPGQECTKQVISWRMRHRADRKSSQYAPQLYAFITEFYKAREWLLDRNPEAMRYAEWRNERKPKEERRADDQLGPSAFSALLADREFEAISDTAARLAARSFITVDVIHDGLHILRPPTGTYAEGGELLAHALAEVSAEVRINKGWRFFKVRIKPMVAPASAPPLAESQITATLARAHSWVGPQVENLAVKRRQKQVDQIARAVQGGGDAKRSAPRTAPLGREGRRTRARTNDSGAVTSNEHARHDRTDSRSAVHRVASTVGGTAMVPIDSSTLDHWRGETQGLHELINTRVDKMLTMVDNATEQYGENDEVVQIEGTAGAIWSIARRHIVALLNEKQWIGDSVLVATMAQIQSHQGAHAAEHEQSIGIDIPLVLPTLWATSIQSDTAASEGETGRCEREARRVRKRFLMCGTVPAAKVCFPVSVRGYRSGAGFDSGGHWVAVEIRADRAARTGSVVVHDGKLGGHVTLLTRLKRIFNIALASDPDDADTHLTLTGTTNKQCPIQSDGSHCACLAANALECLMLGHEVRFSTAATTSMRRRRRMLLYTLQRARQVSADVVVALRRAAEPERRPVRERDQAIVAQARADREEKVDEAARAADSTYWRTMIDQPPEEWRRPVSDPAEFVPGPTAQLLAAVRGARFLAGQRAQYRDRWVAARVVEDSEQRRAAAATDGGRKQR